MPYSLFNRRYGKTAGLVILLFSFLFLSCSRQPLHAEVKRTGDSVILETKNLLPETPVYYSYNHDRVRINFFIVKLDNKVISFLDACMKCYSKKLGFRYDNGSVFCRSCNEQYPVTEIEKGFGSCFPIRIEGRHDGEKYLISIETLERVGMRFFR